MIKRVLSIFFIMSGLLVLGVSTYRPAMEWISDRRNDDTVHWWGYRQYRYGDMASISFLTSYPQFISIIDYRFRRPTDYSDSGRVDLYIQGDSYTGHFPDSVFAGVDKYQHGWRFANNLEYSLDSSKVNILILQTTERYALECFHDLIIFDQIYDTTGKNYVPSTEEKQPGLSELFTSHINSNIEFNLFDYNLFTPIREAKAAINFEAFGRASGDAVLSDDHKRLFLKETVTETGARSSYSPLPESELRLMINNLNAIYDHFREAGFDEVYFAIIPNPSTLLQPENYNGLIPRLQSDSLLKMPFVDGYSLFKPQAEKWYHTGETHWNNDGAQRWIKETNSILWQWNLRGKAKTPHRGSLSAAAGADPAK